MKYLAFFRTNSVVVVVVVSIFCRCLPLSKVICAIKYPLIFLIFLTVEANLVKLFYMNYCFPTIII